MTRIAIVEDEAAVREQLAGYVQRYTRQYGTPFEVTEFADGMEILEDYRPQFDIIFLDVEMKRLNGMETAQRIRETKAAGHRIIAVGTTSCRTLEAVAAKYGEIKACSGNTSIFLYPGVKFNCIDGLITNFHLPESTLIMLVSALYGYEKTMHAYEVAVAEKYRFFSFGDAMLIV